MRSHIQSTEPFFSLKQQFDLMDNIRGNRNLDLCSYQEFDL